MPEKKARDRAGEIPMCTSYFSALTDDEKRDIARADAAQLEQEIIGRKPGTPRPDWTSPSYSVEKNLSLWERLARRLAGDYTRISKVFYLEEYVNRLERRDHLEEITLPTLPERTRARLREVLTTLDTKFRESTVDDDGTAFGDWSRNDPNRLQNKAWWWHRRPEPIPWAGIYPGVPGEPPEGFRSDLR